MRYVIAGIWIFVVAIATAYVVMDVIVPRHKVTEKRVSFESALQQEILEHYPDASFVEAQETSFSELYVDKDIERATTPRIFRAMVEGQYLTISVFMEERGSGWLSVMYVARMKQPDSNSFVTYTELRFPPMNPSTLPVIFAEWSVVEASHKEVVFHYDNRLDVHWAMGIASFWGLTLIAVGVILLLVPRNRQRDLDAELVDVNRPA